MARHHVNPNTGNVGRCTAQNGGCPFGGDNGSDNHYDTPAEAQQAAEKLMAEQYTNINTAYRKKDTSTLASMSSEMKQKIIEDNLAGKNDLHPSVIAKVFSKDNDEEIRKKITESFKSQKILREMSDDESAEVRLGVAKATNNSEVLKAFANDPDERVRKAAAENSKTPVKIKKEILSNLGVKYDKAETPVQKVPVPEPKIETPKVAEPEIAPLAPPVVEPKVEEPKVKAPEPKVEPPKVEVPVAPAPKVEAPPVARATLPTVAPTRKPAEKIDSSKMTPQEIAKLPLPIRRKIQIAKDFNDTKDIIQSIYKDKAEMTDASSKESRINNNYDTNPGAIYSASYTENESNKPEDYKNMAGALIVAIDQGTKQKTLTDSMTVKSARMKAKSLIQNGKFATDQDRAAAAQELKSIADTLNANRKSDDKVSSDAALREVRSKFKPTEAKLKSFLTGGSNDKKKFNHEMTDLAEKMERNYRKNSGAFAVGGVYSPINKGDHQFKMEGIHTNNKGETAMTFFVNKRKVTAVRKNNDWKILP